MNPKLNATTIPQMRLIVALADHLKVDHLTNEQLENAYIGRYDDYEELIDYLSDMHLKNIPAHFRPHAEIDRKGYERVVMSNDRYWVAIINGEKHWFDVSQWIKIRTF